MLGNRSAGPATRIWASKSSKYAIRARPPAARRHPRSCNHLDNAAPRQVALGSPAQQEVLRETRRETRCQITFPPHQRETRCQETRRRPGVKSPFRLTKRPIARPPQELKQETRCQITFPPHQAADCKAAPGTQVKKSRSEQFEASRAGSHGTYSSAVLPLSSSRRQTQNRPQQSHSGIGVLESQAPFRNLSAPGTGGGYLGRPLRDLAGALARRVKSSAGNEVSIGSVRSSSCTRTR
jgi:hypothetical protein